MDKSTPSDEALFWFVVLCLVSVPSAVLQELQGADATAGCEPAGLYRHLQGEAAQAQGAQAEDHPAGRRGHRAGPAEQGADRAVAQGTTDLRSGDSGHLHV